MFKMHPLPRGRRAFTLIELLAVILIIGILSSLAALAVRSALTMARDSAMQTTFRQWATALNSYKATYGWYPNLGAGYNVSGDTYYTLDEGEAGENFVRALSGKNMDGSEISDMQRKSLNKQGKIFCTFPNDAYLDGDPASKKLADYIGNTRIRIVLDTDNTGDIVLKEKPKNKTDLKLQQGDRLNAKIFIATLEEDASKGEGRDIFIYE